STRELCVFAYGAVTLFGRPFQTARLTRHYPTSWSCNPRLSFRIAWFRLFRFRSPLLAESRLFSLPPGTEMVHFPGFASLPLYIQKRIMHVRMHWVSPFGNLRITAC